MLDELFYLQYKFGITDWVVHARIETYSGPLELCVPHALTDGRRLLREVTKPLISFIKEERFFSKAPQGKEFSSGAATSYSTENTYFQNFLKGVLTEPQLTNCENICIAVDCETLGLPHDLRNRSAFPVFSRSVLLEMCDLPPAQWQSLLLEKSKVELASYARLSPTLNDMPANLRERFFSRAPIQKSDLVVSYFGHLGRFLETDQNAVLTSLQFGVTASFGPKKVLVCYRDNELLRGTLTVSNQSKINWEEDSFYWKTP